MELKDFILDNGNIDGTSLKEHWFPLISADIFLSHSHKDIEKVKGFAGWLYNEFGLRAFIDSSVWGYCDELLLEIDKKYCFQPKTDTYSSSRREAFRSAKEQNSIPKSPRRTLLQWYLKCGIMSLQSKLNELPSA